MTFTLSLASIWTWVVGVIVLASTGAVVGALTDGFRRLPLWTWKLLHRGLGDNEERQRRVRDEKRQRLRARFETAVEASEKMRQATESAAWNATQASDHQLREANEIFSRVRTQLLTEAEGQQIVQLFDRLQRNYMEYRVMLQNRDMMREAQRPDLPEYAAQTNTQRDAVIALTDDMLATVQRILQSLEA